MTLQATEALEASAAREDALILVLRVYHALPICEKGGYEQRCEFARAHILELSDGEWPVDLWFWARKEEARLRREAEEATLKAQAEALINPSVKITSDAEKEKRYQAPKIKGKDDIFTMLERNRAHQKAQAEAERGS